MVAAPWRAKAASASLFPAPMPPVTATETGLALFLLSLVGGVRGVALGVAWPLMRGVDRVRLDARVGLLGLDLC
jgi:hypothetical protein